MRMPVVVATALDVLGLLLVAAGVGAGLYPLVGWWCLVPAGAVVIAGSVFGALRDRDGDEP